MEGHTFSIRTRRVGVWLLAAALTLVLAVQVGAEEKIKLHYFTWATGVNSTYIQEDWIEPFMALHPNIEIVHEAVGFGEFWDKLPIYIASGNTPDIIHMSVGYVYDYARLGLLENLQPYFDRDLDPSDFFMEPFKAMRYPSMETGDLYGIPYSFLLTSLYYNKDMFDVSGVQYPDETWSWDFLRDVSRKLTRDTDGDGNADKHGFVSQNSYTLFDPMVHAFGGSILNEDYTKVTLDSPEGIAAAEFLVDMIYKDGTARDGGLNLFTNQSVAMAVMSTAELPYEREIGLNFDVTLVPEGPAQRVVRLWPDSFSIPTASPHKEAAWEFIKYVITREEMDRYSGERKVPVYRSLALSKEWLQPDLMGNKSVFINSILYGHPLEWRPAWGNWDSRLRAELAKAFRGDVAPATAVRQAAQAIQVEIDRALKQP